MKEISNFEQIPTKSEVWIAHWTCKGIGKKTTIGPRMLLLSKTYSKFCPWRHRINVEMGSYTVEFSDST